MKVEEVRPYDEGREKGEQVEQMFDAIAPGYDFMNKAMTFGLCAWWRNRALTRASRLMKKAPGSILDVATGTGDVALAMAGRWPHADIRGVDLSSGMLEVAARKAADKHLDKIIFEQADSLNLPYSDNSFDLVTVAYGVRNFADLPRGLKEMERVLRPGGTLCIVELSEPKGGLLRWFYRLYARHLIPVMGRWVSGDSRAYTYLPESIAACPQRQDMTRLIAAAGLAKPTFRSLTFGVVTIYLATKP